MLKKYSLCGQKEPDGVFDILICVMMCAIQAASFSP